MINLKIYAVMLVVAATLTACGGDSGGELVGGGGGGANACDTSTVSGVTCYINNLIATATLETNDPTDINGLVLATDETSDAVANP
jgi:hypothetical protein